MADKSYEKIVDQIGQLSVMELSELVKALEDTFGVSATPMMQAVASGGQAGADTGAAQAEEKSEYKVTLEEAGSEKIKVIKALRQVTALGLTDAKKAVEEAPTVIAESASKEDSNKMKEALEAAGAKVKLS